MATDPPPNAAAFGQYQLVKLLGKGGMGEVYEAFDPNLARPVALKKMNPQLAADPDGQARFLREARAVAALRNDHIVTIHHVGKRGGHLYLVMEMLEGQTLDKRLATGSELTPAEACRVAREIALGLAAAHEKGLVHRDIKPANIWLERGSGRVKILDFGLVSDPDPDQKLTTPGVIMGTPPFMSPEQARGESVDPRSDLFSLGTVLYRLVTGRLPFDGPSSMDVMHAVTHSPQPPVRRVNPQADPDLAQIIDWLLAKDPARRPQSANAVADALAQVAQRLPTGDAGRPTAVPSPFAPTMPHYSTLDRAKDAAVGAGSSVADSLRLTYDHARKVGRFGTAQFRTRKLSRQFQDDLVAFGAALASGGLGEPPLLRRLAELDDQIANLKAAGRAPGPAADERRGVLIRIATPFAERDRVPQEIEARTELTTAYNLARTSLLNYDSAQKQVAAGRTELIPSDPRARRRLAVGVALVCSIPLLTVIWLASGGGPRTIAGVADEAALKGAVGRVVCGARVIEANGEAKEIPTSSGTAFAITADGALLTNEHVIHDVQTWKNLKDEVPAKFKKAGWREFKPAVWVFFNGQRHDAEILHVSSTYDAAVLKVNAKFAAVFALRADPAVRIGLPVYALGYSEASNIAQDADEAARRKLLGDTLRPRVEQYFPDKDFVMGLTRGGVSRVTTDKETVVQHDAAIHPGNSGGPLMLEDGTVAGINTRTNAQAAGVSFAIGMPQMKAEIEPHARGVVWK